jgi:peptide/nickel transport system substrate-binding protein
MTADDVLYSMNRHYGESSTSVGKSLVSDVTEWKKVDSHTVKAVMAGPNSDLPKILALSQYKIIKDGTTDFQNPVGTGPFRLKEFQTGVRSIHVRNEDYWRETANVEELEIFAITDKIARTSALLTGDIDMMMNLDPKAVPQIERADGVNVWSVPSGSYLGIAVAGNAAPGDNQDFVLALKYIQRREKILRSILKGHGTLGNDQPINTAYGPDFCSDLPIREHDLDRAKFHLKRSGVTEAEIQVAEISPGISDIVLLMQAEARKIGLTLKINTVPNDGYWGSVWMKTPINVTTWNMRPTAGIMMNLAFAPGAAWNDSHWQNDRMGQLLTESRSATDTSLRHEMMYEMQKLIRDESGIIIPAHTNTLDAKSDKIEGIGRMPLGPLGGSEWPEFAWRTDV